MRGIRQELGEIKESTADGGGDASGVMVEEEISEASNIPLPAPHPHP